MTRKPMGHGEQGRAYADYEVNDETGRIVAVIGANLGKTPFEVIGEVAGARSFRFVIPPETKETRWNLPKARQPLESHLQKRMAEPALGS